ncbi:MAG: response regulator transcription factor [Chloroflexi bacterium]|nr:response regulator transcription factor [Chloroflexota bacterium]MBT7081045.1 response regulator transcription factor [Chloroflexota bacterium]MBT7289137.1 response regulator transcription factor [Chloroflexota bacterium]
MKVFLADDHLLFRQGIKSLLSKVTDIEILGEASDGEETIAKVHKLKPDVVLMDITMPKINGLEATKLIKEKLPSVKILILTMHDTDQYLAGMLEAGASGYVVKTAASDELITAIREVNEGDVHLYPSIARMLVEDYLEKAKEGGEKESTDGLTPREHEILKYIAEGKQNKDIAELLFISARTVQAHRTNLMAKIGAHDRTEVVKYAIRKGLTKLEH